MNTQRDKNTNSGILLLHKPQGITSTTLTNFIKRAGSFQKAGHCGTLDPLAEGLLIITVNKATRISKNIMELDKNYITSIKLGEERDTDDIEGRIIHSKPACFSYEAIKEVVKSFIGNQQQTPPQYSAVKIDGNRAYDLARKGESFALPEKHITIHSIKILDYDSQNQMLKLDIHCSHGTFIRSLARDIGREINSYGCVYSLLRKAIGNFTIASKNIILLGYNQEGKKIIYDPKTIENLINTNLIDLSNALYMFPKLILKEEYYKNLIHGQPLKPEYFANDQEIIPFSTQGVTCRDLPDNGQQNHQAIQGYLIIDRNNKALAILDRFLKYKGVFV